MKVFIPVVITFMCVSCVLNVYATDYDQLWRVESQTKAPEIDHITYYKGDIKDLNNLHELNFESCKMEVPSFGTSELPYWFNLDLKNTVRGEEYLLEISYPLLDSITIYFFINDSIVRKVLLGDQVRDINVLRNNTFLIPFNKSEDELEVYVKVKSEGVIVFPVSIFQKDAFYQSLLYKKVFYGMYFGLAFALMLYNFFLFFSIKDKNYLYYVLFVFCVTIGVAVTKGFMFQLLGMHFFDLRQYLIPGFLGITVYSFIHFSRYFLGLEKYAYNIDKVLKWISYSSLFFVLMLFVLPMSVVAKILSVLQLLAAVLCIIGGAICARNRVNVAFVYLAASGLNFVGITIYTNTLLGFIPFNTITSNSMLLSSMFESVLLSLALGMRYKAIMIERDLSKQNILDLQKKANIELELKVKQRTEELTSLLDKNKLLLREVHHRVKNNLQLITSLLNLQMDRIKDEVALNAINESRHRIRSMALVHQKLYNVDELGAKINLKDYVVSLLDELESSNSELHYVTLENDLEDVTGSMDLAVTLGLIINELISNAYKYAFVGRDSGLIRLTINKSNNDLLQLTVSDNGVGINKEKMRKGSLGLKIVDMLSRQHKGELKMILEKGTRFEVNLRI